MFKPKVEIELEDKEMSFESFKKKFDQMLDYEHDSGWYLGFVHGMLAADVGVLIASLVLRFTISQEIGSAIGYVAASICIGSMPISAWQWHKAVKRLDKLKQEREVI
jgi:hypothetical protein